MPGFDPRGANEAGFPWEKDYARINLTTEPGGSAAAFYEAQGFTLQGLLADQRPAAVYTRRIGAPS